MPRYFFHMIDGRVAFDTTGIVLDSELDVRREALRGAGEMIADDGMNLWLGNAWAMTVADENGFVLFNIKFSVEQPKRSSSH